jgi:uncharacterized protein (TIGR00251 family)
MYYGMASRDYVMIMVHVHPNAARSCVIGFREDVLHVKVAAPPVEGKANLELVKFLSGLLGVSRGSVSIEKGATGRRKAVAIAGLPREQVVKLLTQ